MLKHSHTAAMLQIYRGHTRHSCMSVRVQTSVLQTHFVDELPARALY